MRRLKRLSTRCVTALIKQLRVTAGFPYDLCLFWTLSSNRAAKAWRDVRLSPRGQSPKEAMHAPLALEAASFGGLSLLADFCDAMKRTALGMTGGARRQWPCMHAG